MNNHSIGDSLRGYYPLFDIEDNKFTTNLINSSYTSIYYENYNSHKTDCKYNLLGQNVVKKHLFGCSCYLRPSGLKQPVKNSRLGTCYKRRTKNLDLHELINTNHKWIMQSP